MVIVGKCWGYIDYVTASSGMRACTSYHRQVEISGKYKGMIHLADLLVACCSVCLLEILCSICHDLLDPYIVIRIRMWCASLVFIYACFIAVRLFLNCSRRWELDRLCGES
jgi:hypothetical protein